MKNRSSRRKAAAHMVGKALLVVLSLELSSGLVYSVWSGSRFSYTEMSGARSAVVALGRNGDAATPERNALREANLHPFVGFGNPAAFESPLPDAATNLTLVITGGSVAHHLYRDSAHVMEEVLETSGCFGHRPVRVTELAWEGWKQPQQVTALAYYLSVGGSLQLLVNLDGFNEIVVPPTRRDGVFPAYPTQWSRIAATGHRPSDLRLMGQVTLWRHLRFLAAQAAERGRISMTVNVLWRAVDRWLQSALQAAMAQLSEAESEQDSYGRTGPKWSSSSLDARYDFAADTWARGSEILSTLATANGAHYWHFLQPNQYVPHSKQLSPEEDRLVRVDSLREPVKRGYPLLQVRGESLGKRIRFVDATRVFLNEPATVFSDGCCHLNAYGSSILARFIARRIVTDLRSEAECPSSTEDSG